MEACEDPPRPSVAAVRTPSVATKGLLLARIRLAKAEPSEIGSASSLGSSLKGFLIPLGGFVCLSGWVYCEFTSSRSNLGRLQNYRVTVSISPVTVRTLILAVSCLCCPCLAAQEENTQTTVGDYDN